MTSHAKHRETQIGFWPVFQAVGAAKTLKYNLKAYKKKYCTMFTHFAFLWHGVGIEG